MADRKKSTSAARESRLADLAREWLADASDARASEDGKIVNPNKERETADR